ncbi:hypothetical protein XENOCAPTIV_024135 [Xenoophorus captivus]|uniref:B box-type domain-containing protein n=1 Tax=Xenoophorus captivus TaxID=1517983 RepID=A0ABV0RDL7_9TELE
MTANPVTLKCNHRFCQRCIGDLWSISPSGPYHCPESRCKIVYQTLPFDKSFIRPTTPSRQPPPRSAAGKLDKRLIGDRTTPHNIASLLCFTVFPQTAVVYILLKLPLVSPISKQCCLACIVFGTGTSSSQNEQSTSASGLKRTSLTSRLLGKRKASTPVSEEHVTKRTAVESPYDRSRTTEIPTTSLSDEPGHSTVGMSTNDVDPESTLSARGDSKSPTKNSDSEVAENDVPQDVPVKQNQQKIEPSDDSDSSSEVDLCDAPITATPKRDASTAGIYISPRKPASPAVSDSRPAGLNPGKESAPVNRTPLIATKSPAAASGSSNHFGLFFKPEKTSTSPVPCHYCPKTGYQPAVKTCLVCGASMCKEHLRPHLESPVFQNHTLVSPVEDISLWRCQEHHEINRIYCKQCAACVCTVCTVIGSHRDHACISIREAERELRVSAVQQVYLE